MPGSPTRAPAAAVAIVAARACDDAYTRAWPRHDLAVPETGRGVPVPVWARGHRALPVEVTSGWGYAGRDRVMSP